MTFPFGFKMLALAVLVAVGTSGCSSTAKVTESVVGVLPFAKKKEPTLIEPGEDADTVVHTQNITFVLKVTPEVIKLSETRQLDVKIRLVNTSKRFIQLAFPTTQRIEILLRASDGKVVTQWSEDRSFEPTIGYVAINPGEHIEYAATISTRDLEAGKSYTLHAFFPNFLELKGEKLIVPEA